MSADNLCQANLWTRTAVPFLALEASLQQRQLDTLAFFFKAKQNCKHETKECRISSASNLPHFCGNPQFLFSLEISVLGFPTSGKKILKKNIFFVKNFFP